MKKSALFLIGIGAIVLAAISVSRAPAPPAPLAATSAAVDSSPLSPHCSDAGPHTIRCYEAYYEALVKQEGLAHAFADIESRYNEDSHVKANCHPMVHAIGRMAARILPNVAEAFSQGKSFCWSGYYHGVMEYMVSRLEKENVSKDLNEICAPIREKRSSLDVAFGRNIFDYYNCVHGLGHGLMAISYNELIDSLASCDQLTGSIEPPYCWSGVFMENIIAAIRGDHTKYLRANDPFYPCNAVADKYRNVCYLMQTSQMLRVMDYDFAEVFELCGMIEPQHRDVCYQSLGRDASGQTASDVLTTKERCLLGKNFREQSNCIAGAAKDFISYFRSDIEARKLCAAFTDDLEKSCLNTVETFYTIF